MRSKPNGVTPGLATYLRSMSASERDGIRHTSVIAFRAAWTHRNTDRRARLVAYSNARMLRTLIGLDEEREQRV
jgi:hypothetical protein